MSKKKVVVKKGGFSVVSLIIGILIGIIIMLGCLGGAIAYLVFGDIDSILSMFGVVNQDEDGNYIYVNTDTENGGISSVMDLISWYLSLESYKELTVQQICDKLPVVDTYVSMVYDMVTDYGINLSKTEVYSWKFGEFTDKIKDAMMDIELGALLNGMGVDESSEFGSNVIVKAMIYGIQAPYVYTDDGKYPVWYDEYYVWDPNAPTDEDNSEENTEDEDGTEDGIATTSTAATDVDPSSGVYLKNRLDDRLLETEYWPYATLNADGYYRLYYYGYPLAEDGFPETDDDGNYVSATCYVTYEDENGDWVEKPQNLDERLEYTTDCPTLKGNYYFVNGIEDSINANPITIRKLTDNPYENLYEIYITDLYDDEEALSFLADVLDGVSLAELINGDVDFAEIVDNLELSSIMDVQINTDEVNSAESILLYLLYGVSSVSPVDEMENTYTGLYRTVEGDKENGFTNGEEVECYIKTDSDGNIESVYIQDADGNWVEAAGTTISQVDTRMNGLMDDLTISEIVDVSELNNPIIDMIKDSTINGFAADINHMTMNQLFCNDIYGVASDDDSDELVATLYDVVESDPTDGQMAFNSEYTYYIKTENSAILVPVGDGYSVDPDTGEITPGNGHYDSWEALTSALDTSEVEVVSYGEARPLWKLLIYETVKGDDETVTQYEVAYQVSDMNNMYYNIQYNVQNATLATLKDAVMLDITDEFLDSYLYAYSNGSFVQSEKQVKDMTLIELLNYIQQYFTTNPTG